MVSGLKRALENDNERYGHVSKVVRKYMRTYVTSIFLIKGAERKIREMEMQVKREADSINKRTLGEEERPQLEEQFRLFSASRRKAG
jgi:hypothetical protein